MKKRVATFLIAVMVSFSIIIMTSYRAYCETDSVYTDGSTIYAEEEPKDPDCCLPPGYVRRE